MEDCLKSIVSDIDTQSFLQKLEEVSGYIESENVNIDKTIIKNVIMAFLNSLRFATKQERCLLESYLSLLASVGFFTPTIKPLLKVLMNHAGVRSVKDAYSMLRVCCCALPRSIVELKESILETKVRLVEEITEKSVSCGVLAIHYLLSNEASGADADAYLEECITVCATNDELFLLSKSLFTKCLKDKSCQEKWTNSLVKSYTSFLSSIRSTASSCFVQSGKVIASLCNHDFLTTLVPALSRAVKRNADVFIPCLLACLEGFTVDLSRYLNYLMDCMLWCCKHQVSTPLHTILLRCSDGEMVVSSLSALMKAIDELRLTPMVRRDYYIPLEAYLCSINEKVMGRVEYKKCCVAICKLLVDYIKKESNGSVKVSLISLLCCCCRSDEESSYDEVLAALLKQTGATLTAGLYLLSALLSSKHYPAICSTYYTILASLMDLAKTKPITACRDGCLAMYCHIQLCLHEGKDTTTVVQELLKEGSFLYHPNLLNSNNKEDEMCIRWCNQVCLWLVSTFLTQHWITQTSYRAMFLVFSQFASPIKSVRDAASVFLAVTSKQYPEICMEAFYSYLVSISAVPFYNDEYPVSCSALRPILFTMVRNVPTYLPIIIYCSSHPYLNTGKKNRGCWKEVSHMIQPDAFECSDDSLRWMIRVMNDEQVGILSSNFLLRNTAARSIAVIASIPSLLKQFYSLIEGPLKVGFSSTLITSITAHDLEIWQTPSFVEWKQVEESGYVAEVVTRKNMKKDDKWAAELNYEVNKEKIDRENAERVIKERVQALNDQQMIRDKVETIAIIYRKGLAIVESMIDGMTMESMPIFVDVMQQVYTMLNNPLVVYEARSVYCRGCRIIESKSLSELLHSSLYQVFYHSIVSTSLLDSCMSLFNTTIRIMNSSGLALPYLPLYIPIIKSVTFMKENAAALPLITSILNYFSEIDEEDTTILYKATRYEICEICLELLRISPRIEPSPESVLMQFCDHAPCLSSREVLLLLGDRGLLSPSEDVRLNSLINLENMENFANPLYIIRVFMSQYDENEEIADEAKQQWEEKKLALTPTYYLPLFQLLGHSIDKIRRSASCAIANGCLVYSDAVGAVISKCIKKCEEVEAIEDPKEKKEQSITVLSLFMTIEECAKLSVFTIDHLPVVFDFIFTYGFTNAEDAIRLQSMASGESIVDSYSDNYGSVLLEELDRRLSSMRKDGDTEAEMIKQDHQREGCIVLLGKCTSYLVDGDSRIQSTLSTLLSSLSIPSASVQDAVARVLIPLFKFPSVRNAASPIIQSLLQQLVGNESYAARRGASLGLAGAIKGIGSKAFKEYNINSFIETSAQSPDPHAREGSMLAIESLCDTLTVLFEPYVVRFLPLLLENFSYKDEDVRDAAKGASKAVMRNLSPAGVKLIMPKVLEALSDSRWRTKEVAITMLGSMAYCSPQSLSSCLPRIVPVLTESCNDAHDSIQKAAASALLDIGNVIRTPEIADLQQGLIKALTEPHLYTGKALKTLTETSFHHTMDAPSLSLIIPILLRGLNDRSTETKKKAALITGNICSLANKSDVMPYLQKLINPLKKVLMDPLPDVRAVAAHSIGMLGKEVGEEEMKEVLEWLIEKVYEDSTVAERSGAAQGLADMLSSISEQHFNEILTELLNNSRHPRACVREGVLWTVSFLPSTLGNRFTSLISLILPAIVTGLADESDMVAEVALRAGQVIVKNYAKSDLSSVLPPVKDAMMDDDWRIRQSSIQLMGELLYTLGKTKAVGMAENETDTGLSSSNVEVLLQQELGMQSWIEIMSVLFFLTTDNTAAVRQSSMQVWKSVVNNTPRTLKKLLGELTRLCFAMFTSDSENKRTLAALCLGEIVQKLGEFVIPHVLKVLNDGMVNEDPVIRQVVCMGFVQVLQNCSPSVIKAWSKEFLSSLENTLCDEDESVREAAAEALTVLQKKGNSNVIDEILPILLRDLEAENVEKNHRALNGLKQIIVLQGKQAIQTLFTKLTARPLSVSHLHILQSITPSTTKYLHFYFGDMCDDFLLQLYGKNDEPEDRKEESDLLQAIQQTLQVLVINVQTNGIQWVITHIDKCSNMINNGYRREACRMLNALICETKSDYMDQMQLILRCIIKRAADSDGSVVDAAWAALSSLVTKNRVEDMLNYVSFMSNMIATVISSERYKPGVDMKTYVLPAFENKEGLKPLFLLLQKGIMIASAERKADCASLICDLVQYAPAACVRVYALQITGPLIRIIGDKYPTEIRVVIYRALDLLLGKSAEALRPFLPQLQTTFLRALKDGNKEIRELGGDALVHIIALSNRVDNIVSDLSDGVMANTPEIRESVMKTLLNILLSVGTKVSTATLATVEERMITLLTEEEEDVRGLAASVLAAELSFTPESHFAEILDSTVFKEENSDMFINVRHGKCAMLGQLLKYNAERCIPYHEKIIRAVTGYLKDDSLIIRKNAISVCKYVLNVYTMMTAENKKLVLEEMMCNLSTCVYDTNSSVRYETVVSISLFARICNVPEMDLLSALVPTLLKSVQDSYIPVKLASERALASLLQINTNPSILENYVKTIPMAEAKYLKTYVQRVLIKLPKPTEEENIDF